MGRPSATCHLRGLNIRGRRHLQTAPLMLINAFTGNSNGLRLSRVFRPALPMFSPVGRRFTSQLVRATPPSSPSFLQLRGLILWREIP